MRHSGEACTCGRDPSARGDHEGIECKRPHETRANLSLRLAGGLVVVPLEIGERVDVGADVEIVARWIECRERDLAVPLALFEPGTVRRTAGDARCTDAASERETSDGRGDSHAYGSVVWGILALHFTPGITGIGEDALYCVLLFVGPVEDKHRTDIEVSAPLIYFVAVGGFFIWALIFLPVLLEGST